MIKKTFYIILVALSYSKKLKDREKHIKNLNYYHTQLLIEFIKTIN